MTKPLGLNDMDRDTLIELLNSLAECFQKSFIRSGETSTSVYFFNTKNSVNTYINIDNKLLADYQINLQELLTTSETGL